LFAFILFLVLAPITYYENHGHDLETKTLVLINLTYLLFSFFLGLCGNRVWAYHLRTKGFVKSKTIESMSQTEAVELYIKGNGAQNI